MSKPLNRLLLATPSEALRENAMAALRGAGHEVSGTTNAAAARAWLAQNTADIVLIDLTDKDGARSDEMAQLMAELRSSPSRQLRTLALVRAHTTEHFRRLFTDRRITNFLAVDETEGLDPRELSVTVEKILSNDFFGVTRYLAGAHRLETFRLTSSHDKDAIVDRAATFARDAGCHPRMAQHVAVVADELVTNAVYNAPIGADGNRRFAQLPRSVPVELDSDHVIEVALACDDRALCVSARDPYGSLPPTRVLEYLARCFDSERAEPTDRSGGAGLGLFYLFQLVNSFVINLAPGTATETIGLFEISRSYKAYAGRRKSFNLFVQEPVSTQPQA